MKTMKSGFYVDVDDQRTGFEMTEQADDKDALEAQLDMELCGEAAKLEADKADNDFVFKSLSN